MATLPPMLWPMTSTGPSAREATTRLTASAMWGESLPGVQGEAP